MKFYQRFFILLILIAIPILVWVSMEPLSQRFQNLSVTTTSLGQILAISGIIMLSLTFILNSRIKILDKIFNGLNNSYIAHHSLGTIAFLFLLFHPLLLSIKYLIFSIQNALSFLSPLNQLATFFGFAALSIMIILLFITFLINLKYKNWKLTHQFMGLALILAGIHVLLITSDISRNPFLKVYVLAFVIMGICFYIYRTPLSRYLVKRYSYEVVEVKELNRNLAEIILKPFDSNKSISGKPGQFLFISFYDQEKKISDEQHPFTISSSPHENNLRLSIKKSGDYTMNIHELKSGTMAFIEGPFGDFVPKFNKEQIWISGGIGITPFLSMARSLIKEDKEIRKVDFYYSFRDKSEDVFSDELKKISEKYKQLKLFPRYTGKEGRLKEEDIEKNYPNGVKEKEIFISGPGSMIKNIKREFKNKGVPKGNMHSEEFSFLD